MKVKNKYGVIVIIYKRKKDKLLYALFKRQEGWIGYEFLKGGREKEETDNEAAIREIKEEASLSVKNIKRSSYDYCFESQKAGETVRHNMSVFYIKIEDDDKILIDSKEHSEFGFFDSDRVKELIQFDSLKELFKKVDKEIQKYENN